MRAQLAEGVQSWISILDEAGCAPGVNLVLAALSLWSPVLADDGMPKQDGKTPLMVSFWELKWTDLPERKGMQFAVLSGDPKTGAYTQMRTRTAANSRT